jgi:hypothetical protein
MGEARGRRWFQLHLITAIALVIASGVFLSLNVEPESIPGLRLIDGLKDFESDFGWPLSVRSYIVINGMQCYSRISSDGRVLYVYKPRGLWAYDSYTLPAETPREHYNRKNLALNFGFCLLLLGMIGCFCEYLIRKAESRDRQRSNHVAI